MSAPESRTERIAGRIRDDILSGAYKPGERLPAERDLASQLGVNRSSVREALKQLEQLGLVAIRRGDGTTVQHLHDASVEVVRHLLVTNGRVDRRLLEQLLDVQEMLIAGAALLAVERGSQEDLQRARTLVARLGDAHLGPAELHSLLDEIVDLITQASGNLVLRLVRNTIRPALAEHFRGIEKFVQPRPESLAAAARAIDAALLARDAAATESAVRTLLRTRRERVLAAVDVYETTGR